MNEITRKPAHTVTELASDRQHQKTGRPSWGMERGAVEGAVRACHHAHRRRRCPCPPPTGRLSFRSRSSFPRTKVPPALPMRGPPPNLEVFAPMSAARRNQGGVLPNYQINAFPVHVPEVRGKSEALLATAEAPFVCLASAFFRSNVCAWFIKSHNATRNHHFPLAAFTSFRPAVRPERSALSALFQRPRFSAASCGDAAVLVCCHPSF